MQVFEPTEIGRLVYKKIMEKYPLYKATVDAEVAELEWKDEPIKMFTCANCPVVHNFQLQEDHPATICRWAFDLYNTNGDCLAMK